MKICTNEEHTGKSSELKQRVVIRFETVSHELIGVVTTPIPDVRDGDAISIIGCNMVVFDGRLCAMVPLERTS